MPLNDRQCYTCNNYAEDLIEKSDNTEYQECPVCHLLTFKRLIRPCHFDVSGISAQMDYLDLQREKAANGHGNTSLGTL